MALAREGLGSLASLLECSIIDLKPFTPSVVVRCGRAWRETFCEDRAEIDVGDAAEFIARLISERP